MLRLLALVTATTSWAPARIAPQPPRAAVRLQAAPPHPSLGSLTLVGAGPGDPELLTVAALRAIADSEALVICDRLVSPEIRELVRGELRVAGKLPGCAEKAQQQIYDWCREGLVEGRRVVRLKIGDPFVFGRGGEEVLELRERLGVEARVVPGVSACLAAPLAAGVPVTHRGAAHQTLVSTGYGRGNSSSPELPPYDPRRTIVLLMAVGRLRSIVDDCVASQDFPLDCPALVVEQAATPRQRTVLGDLSDIADLAERHSIKAPATVVFGDAVRALHQGVAHGLIEMPEPTGFSPVIDVRHAGASRPASLDVSATLAQAAP
jgi:uroporphyrin-III C-methyltransferase